jgi:hypothetical protein
MRGLRRRIPISGILGEPLTFGDLHRRWNLALPGLPLPLLIRGWRSISTSSLTLSWCDSFRFRTFRDLFQAGTVDPEEAVRPVLRVRPDLQLYLFRWREEPELGNIFPAFTFDLFDRQNYFFKSYGTNKDHVRHGPDKKIADAVGRVRYSRHAAAFLRDGDSIVDSGC